MLPRHLALSVGAGVSLFALCLTGAMQPLLKRPAPVVVPQPTMTPEVGLEQQPMLIGAPPAVAAPAARAAPSTPVRPAPAPPPRAPADEDKLAPIDLGASIWGAGPASTSHASPHRDGSASHAEPGTRGDGGSTLGEAGGVPGTPARPVRRAWHCDWPTDFSAGAAVDIQVPVRVSVDADGVPTAVSVLSPVSPAFAAAATRCAMGERYVPGTGAQGERIARQTLPFTIRFLR